jgi:hypothetical protein
MANDYGITLDDAVNELQYEVEEAINFMWSEFEEDWAKAERYYAGGCDLPTEEGRSNAVKTEVRDIIRAAKPNIMRVLFQSRKPVEYIPSHISHAGFIHQQSTYVSQLFSASGGYKILSNAVDQALKLKAGPIKTFWEENPTPKFHRFTGLTAEEVEQIKAAPDVEVLTVEDYVVDAPNLGDVEFYEVTCRQYLTNGKICVEDFPIYEFFVSRNATSLEDARVHGHHRSITVAEAIDMGLEYDNWTELVGTDPENKYASAQSRARRGYSVDADENDSEDITQKEILLTEVYCKYDLDGDGREERYVFYLGGTGYKYISHHEIEDYCIDLVAIDPMPYTVIGRSLADLTIEMQDNETSILRAIIDNAHMANNPRIAGDPNSADFDDVMNNAVGAPIKTRGASNLQIIDIPFTGANLIPFMEYMEKDTENRVGITKAATGLDPDALQSTDKDAVLNTIQLSQGQVELMARNIVETGLIGVFKKLLRLSIRHMDRIQVVRTKGLVLPIDVTMFDPDLAAEPNVGLGSASHQEKLATLNFILQKQEQIIGQFGMDNPFTNLSQMYNTLEDIVEMGGMRDPGRYFQVVTPQMEQQIAQERAKAAQAQAQQNPPPMDPSKALLQVEQLKASIRKLEITSDARQKELDLQFKATESVEKLDIERDRLVQERMIKLREMGEQRLNAMIESKQEANNRDKPDQTGTGGASSGGSTPS